MPGGHVDYIGFGVLALWLATLQVVLDRGQQDDWFNATWLCGPWSHAFDYCLLQLGIVICATGWLT